MSDLAIFFKNILTGRLGDMMAAQNRADRQWMLDVSRGPRQLTLYELSCKYYGKEYTDAMVEGYRILAEIPRKDV